MIGGIAIKKFFKSIDFFIIAIVIILFSIGAIALYSAEGGADGETGEAMKQLAWFGVGIVVMIIVMAIDYEVLGRLWIPLCALMLLALFLVLFTEPINRCY